MANDDVANAQAVSVDGRGTIIVMAPRHRMSKREALVHAAWLVALADEMDDQFPAILEAVRNT